MAKAMSAAERFAAIAPKAIPVEDLAGTITVPLVEVEDYDGGFAALYVGTLDEAETVHLRVYLGKDASSLRKLAKGFKVSEVNPRESQHQTRKRVMKWAWGDPKDYQSTFATLYIPDRATTDAVEVVIGE